MGRRVAIVSGFEGAGMEGELLAIVIVDKPRKQEWAVVLWDGHDDPSLFKVQGLKETGG